MVPFSIPVGRSRSGGGGPPLSHFCPFFNQKEKVLDVCPPLTPCPAHVLDTFSHKIQTLREIKRNADDCLPDRGEANARPCPSSCVCRERSSSSSEMGGEEKNKKVEMQEEKKEELLAHGRGSQPPNKRTSLGAEHFRVRRLTCAKKDSPHPTKNDGRGAPSLILS